MAGPPIRTGLQLEETMGESCAFKASFPTIQGAIKISGDGGMRLTLEVPESELDKAAPIMRMRGEVLKITVETE